MPQGELNNLVRIGKLKLEKRVASLIAAQQHKIGTRDAL